MTIYSISTSVPYDSSIYLVVSDRTMLVDAGTGEDPELPMKIGMLLNGIGILGPSCYTEGAP